jgi:hypothetical protein
MRVVTVGVFLVFSTELARMPNSEEAISGSEQIILIFDPNHPSLGRISTGPTASEVKIKMRTMFHYETKYK